MQIRVICCELRSLPRIRHFSRPVKRNRFIFTWLIPMLLRLTFQQHSTPNRKKRSPSSSVRTGTSLHGNLLTCQVFLGDWLSIVCESTQKLNWSKNIFDGPPYIRERQSVKKWLGF